MLVASLAMSCLMGTAMPAPGPEEVCAITVVSVEDLNLNQTVDYVAYLETLPAAATAQMPREYRQVSIRGLGPAPSFTMEPKWESSGILEPQAIASIEVLRGLGAQPKSISEFIRGLRQVQRHYEEQSTPIQINPNIDLKPNGLNVRTYGYELMDQYCQVRLAKEWTIDGVKNSENVSTSQIQVGSAWIPMADPYSSQFFPDSGSEKSPAEILGGAAFYTSDGKFSTIYMPSLPAQPVMDVLKYGGLIAPQLTGEVGEKFKTNPNRIRNFIPQGSDMNYLYLPWSGTYPGDWDYDPDDCDFEFFAPPGTLWYPSNPAYQIMMSGVHYRYRTPFLNLLAEINGGQEDDGRIRVLCMNMAKKEPARGVDYFPYRPSDPIIPQLAKLMDESSFRGPWDQARLWIYTDKASLDDINKRIVAKLPPAGYVMGLADVDWVGGLTDEMRRDRKFARPDFIASSATPEYASNFLLNVLDFDQPKVLGEWLAKNPDALTKLASGDEFDQNYLTRTVRRILSFQSPEDRIAMLRVISTHADGFVVLKGQLGTGLINLNSDQAQERELATQLQTQGFFAPEPRTQRRKAQ